MCVISASFRGEEDDSVYIWIRRFEDEAERERLYQAVYESDVWLNTLKDRVGEVMNREAMKITLIVPTSLSILQ